MYGRYSTFVFWAWNDKVTREGIDRQLHEFYDAGIGGVVIHARAGLKIEYMSNEWLSLFKYAVQSAKAIGLKVVIYDENGWPSGFAGGEVVKQNADYAMKNLVFCKEKPIAEEVLCSYKKVGDIYELDGDDLFVCVKKNFDYVDVTDKAVTETFVQLTHEKYKEICGDEFGETVIGVFTDEPQYSSFEHFSYPYSNGIDSSFFAFSGMNLKENLWRLYAEKDGEFKKQYLQFFANRFLQNYTAVIASWCKENGLEMMGHYSAEDGVISGACGNAGVMPHYRLMQRPGIDYLGRRYPSPVLFKQLESVKNQEKKQVVLSESYGGAGWGATLQDYAKMWCYQAVFGVNQLCAHLSPYSIAGVRKRDYPGFFSKVQPWWAHAKAFFGRVERLNELLSSGIAKNRIAVIHPVSVALKQENFSALQKELSTQFRVLTENLISAQLDFDYVEESALKNAKIDGNKLIVGSCAYEVVLMLKESYSEELSAMVSSVKTGIVGVDLFNRRAAICRWFDEIGYRRNAYFSDGEDVADGLIMSYKEREDGTPIVYVFNPSHDADKTVYLNGVFQSLKEISFNGEEKILSAKPYENGSFCKVFIPAGSGKTYIFQSEAVTSARSAETRILLKVGTYKLQDRNCLTIDKAAYSFDGKNYSEMEDVIKVASDIYSVGGNVWIKYCFTNHSNVKDLTLFTENGEQSILVNGKIPLKKDDTFFERNLLAYDISNCLKEGENSVILQFYIPENFAVQTDWEFESLRNIYFLPVEVENIYLVGDFSVEAKMNWASPKYLIAKEGFILIDKTEYSLENITQTGAPFYRGALEICGKMTYSKGDVWIQAGFFGALSVLYVNGKEAGVVFNGETLCITEYLRDGENEVKLVLYSTNRNLLGAHHHAYGEVKMTGRNTFEGKRGFEDFVNANVQAVTYTKSYSFVPFGVEKIELIIKE